MDVSAVEYCRRNERSWRQHDFCIFIDRNLNMLRDLLEDNSMAGIDISFVRFVLEPWRYDDASSSRPRGVETNSVDVAI